MCPVTTTKKCRENPGDIYINPCRQSSSSAFPGWSPPPSSVAMGKQKQQVISRFFGPKTPADPAAHAPPKTKQQQQVISRFFAPKEANAPATSPPPTSPPKVSATVSFSPHSKRALQQKLEQARPSPSPPPNKKLKSTPTATKGAPGAPAVPPFNPSLHQRFLDKLMEPSTPSSASLHAARTPVRNPKYTPLEQQVVELKARYPDVLLMVEVGYRYRFFGEDAEIAANVLGIVSHMDHNFLTASIPTFRLHVHVRRLVSAGHKVGVVKQQETAVIKAHGANKLGPFSRGLSALYTKSTIEAAEDMGGRFEEGLGGASSSYLVCIVEKGNLVCNEERVHEGSFDVRIGVVAVEISTGDVIHGEFNDNITRSGLEAVLFSLSPAEILLGEPLSAPTEKLLLGYAGPASETRVERMSCDCFNDGGALAEVMSLYEKDDIVSDLDHRAQIIDAAQERNQHHGVEIIMAMSGLAVQALALTIRYLQQFGFERMLCLGASFRPLVTNSEINLSANTLHQLEVLRNKSDGSMDGTLLHVMNHTHTSFGLRLLKHWFQWHSVGVTLYKSSLVSLQVTHPLCDRYSILARLDAVSEIAESMGSYMGSDNLFEQDEESPSCSIAKPNVSHLLSSVLTTVGKLPDLQRGVARIFYRTATTAEFVTVVHAILFVGKQLRKLNLEDERGSTGANAKIVQSGLLRRLILTISSSSVIAHASKLLSCLNKDAADQGDLLNLFNLSNGQFPEVSGSQIASQLAKEKLDLLIAQYRKQLGMCDLEFITVSGTTHLIELPLHKRVPSDWVKISSTKKAIRYHPPEVLTALDELLLTKEELAVTCRAAWNKFLADFGRYYAEFQAAVQALAALDCLHSLAILSRKQNFVRPIFVGDDEPNQIHIHSGRHPILESILGETFVPNDTNLHADGEFCQIVTGPNMGGKSCYIRQVALISIMAQVGSFVPASFAKLHMLDGIYTRMGASDSIQQGRSTFLEELSEVSHILQTCTSRSLVIIDELGRGTSTHDGFAIAYASLQYLLWQKKCLVLFVTHYPKIKDIKHEFVKSVGTYHVSYLTSQKLLHSENNTSDVGAVEKQDQPDITFLYKVIPGASDKSFGLNVARLAQLPSSCIERAAVMAAKLELELNERVENQFKGNMLSILCGYDSMDRLNTDGTLCRDKEDFTRLASAIRRLFLHLQFAYSDAGSLRVAKELALQLVSVNWGKKINSHVLGGQMLSSLSGSGAVTGGASFWENEIVRNRRCQTDQLDVQEMSKPRWLFALTKSIAIVHECQLPGPNIDAGDGDRLGSSIGGEPYQVVDNDDHSRDPDLVDQIIPVFGNAAGPGALAGWPALLLYLANDP
ncbi:hypothetical protein Taro_047786 [Colocasia esculenta]|uniref:DNA mismatch repair protein MSH3 n=1 Tax=Colocasia esculenta TaxID=4460 RepID=A0A843X4B9_COLES|nr:hypothetical protein [Colocasia esculenta]